MTTKKTSVKTNSPGPPATKSSKLRSKSGTTIPPGKQKTTSAPVKKVNPWDNAIVNPLAPGKEPKTSAAKMKSQVKAWIPKNSPFFR
jgi:hypothetical protein